MQYLLTNLHLYICFLIPINYIFIRYNNCRDLYSLSHQVTCHIFCLSIFLNYKTEKDHATVRHLMIEDLQVVCALESSYSIHHLHHKNFCCFFLHNMFKYNVYVFTLLLCVYGLFLS